ncbi:hypothetical protein EGK68_25785 [Enterobacter cloacae]|uniref:Uncharacterized protein n=1 Tax=Enterobacter cloacae TaxID=550 RepID=A0A427KDS5_ENTCL|nr:hypothetical protein EGK68_25785 [Enterobacter cloacae]
MQAFEGLSDLLHSQVTSQKNNMLSDNFLIRQSQKNSMLPDEALMRQNPSLPHQYPLMAGQGVPGKGG